MGSPFINDPKRHRILESIIDFPDNTKVPSILPDKQTADILIESYFINVRPPTAVGCASADPRYPRRAASSRSLTGKRLSME
jgi:hypothetical protein